MSELLSEVVVELARALDGTAIEADGSFSLDLRGVHASSYPVFLEPQVAGKFEGRAVAVDFHRNGEVRIRVQCPCARRVRIVPCGFLSGFLSFSRRVKSGDSHFDEEFRVEHETGPTPEALVASGEFREAVRALAPFEEASCGEGVLRATVLYHPDEIQLSDILTRVRALDALARLAEEEA